MTCAAATSSSALAQEDLDDQLAVQPPFVDVLLRDVLGHCHYFDARAHQCRVHESRPLPCRLYDCRDEARAVSLRSDVNRDTPFAVLDERTCQGAYSHAAVDGRLRGVRRPRGLHSTLAPITGCCSRTPPASS